MEGGSVIATSRRNQGVGNTGVGRPTMCPGNRLLFLGVDEAMAGDDGPDHEDWKDNPLPPIVLHQAGPRCVWVGSHTVNEYNRYN